MRNYQIFETELSKAEVLPCGIKVLKGSTATGSPTAIVWRPKAKNPFANYRFKDEQRREEYIQECVKNYEAQQERKNQYKQERKGTIEDLKKVKVGDLFVSSWGYDQTNIDYYQITAINGHMATIQRVMQQDSLDQKNDVGCDYVMPAPYRYIDKPMNKKIQFSGGKPYFSLESYTNAYPFEGKARYQTSVGFGH